MPVKGNKFCEVCNKDILAKNFADHKKTKTHEQKAEQRGAAQSETIGWSTSGVEGLRQLDAGGHRHRPTLLETQSQAEAHDMPLNLWLDILLLGVIISWLLISYIINILSIEYSRIILHIISLEMILLQKGIE